MYLAKNCKSTIFYSKTHEKLNILDSFADSSFMEETISKTNVFYGGLDPQIDNVFFTHGEMDPQRSLGPSEDINPNSPVVVMSRKCCLK